MDIGILLSKEKPLFSKQTFESNTIIPRSINWHDTSLLDEWVFEGIARPRLPERLEPNTRIHQVYQDDNGRVTIAFDRSYQMSYRNSGSSDASSRPSTLNLGRITPIPSIINTTIRSRHSTFDLPSSSTRGVDYSTNIPHPFFKQTHCLPNQKTTSPSSHKRGSREEPPN